MGTVFHGALISLSEKGAQLRLPHFLQLLSNLKLKLLIEAKLATEEEHIYAKVIQQSHVDEHLYLLRFTAVSPKAMSDDKPSGFGSDASGTSFGRTQSTGTAKTATPSPLGAHAILDALRQTG